MEDDMVERDVRAEVREAYAQVAKGQGSCCGPGECGDVDEVAARLGYGADERAAAPEGANLGLGCGNPVALAELKPGETVVDLGAGAGFDAILAARRVGPKGKVIGVDMTPEMLERARKNAAKAGLLNVKFVEGVIEALPLEDATADVIISNCVLNLSPDKPRAFREALRALKPGGRLRVTDIATTRPIPEALKDDVAAWCGCVAGALTIDQLRADLATAGFEDIRIDIAGRAADLLGDTDPLVAKAGDELKRDLADIVVSARISARRPG
jgi:arsenite methyltransferase